MHLLIGKAIYDVRARAFQAARPLDIILFVETRL